MSSSLAMPRASSYWCYRCRRFVGVWPQDSIVCPDCDGGFLEDVRSTPRLARRYLLNGDGAFPDTLPDLRTRRHRPSGVGGLPPFNPFIVLRRPADGRDADRPESTSFELYYDDGMGSGLRPLPPNMSGFLLGSGLERLLDQISQIELNGLAGRSFDHPPASKAAMESMPMLDITASHVAKDCHCAVCMEKFELGVEAMEMPCKHIYHRDCIFSWLSLRNSCPVCRHEMPSDVRASGAAEPEGGGRSPSLAVDDETLGLTVWRLPGGGFAVGRFSGGVRVGDRRPPVVYTEMDGGFNSGGTPRRISRSSRGNRSRQSRGIGRVFRSIFSFFGRRRSSPSSSSSSDSGFSFSESYPSGVSSGQSPVTDSRS